MIRGSPGGRNGNRRPVRNQKRYGSREMNKIGYGRNVKIRMNQTLNMYGKPLCTDNRKHETFGIEKKIISHRMTAKIKYYPRESTKIPHPPK